MGARAAHPAPRNLYELDFFEWTARNAALLRAKRFSEADIEHIAEEIEDMGKSQQKELASRLRVLLIHLLKWRIQPAQRSASWEETIDTQRAEISDLLDFMPSLRRTLPEVVETVYPRAVRWAAKETRQAKTRFSEACPFTVEQILDEGFFPE
jgi:hypothetical protein